MRSLARLALWLFDRASSVLDALGLTGSRWQWRRMQWRRTLEARAARLENVARAVEAPTRMCRECRSLVDRDSSRCPDCGASMAGISRGGAGRLVGLVLPDLGAMRATTLILAADVILLILAMSLGGGSGSSTGVLMGGPSPAALFALGSNWGPAVAAGQVWRLVTAVFLHGGLLHIFFNGYALLALGPLVEESFGKARFYVIYLVCGVASFVASSLWTRAPSVGASGALFGLLGFLFVYGRYRGGRLDRAISEHVGRWIVFGMVMVFMPGIDNAAHFGGLAAGALLALAVGPPGADARSEALWSLGGWLTLGLTLASFVAMILAFPENIRMLSAG